MLVYRRDGYGVTPYWQDSDTGNMYQLTWDRIKKGGSIKGANEPFYNRGKPYNYSRVGWSPFYIYPTGRYTNPRQLKSDGSYITSADWVYRE